jgi:cysteinyl-tRNA synthetase
MRAIIERLVQGGFAYVAEDHVLFSPQAMNAANSVLPRYGALANRSLDEMIAGARVDVAPYKRDATDFVLWKPSKPGEPSWPSPAGIRVEGRPGWHIECSAMSWKHLGEQFDIHGGGIDLVFPHHENELAQSCCAFHENRMANVWMHNGFLQVEGEKMSKSLGNFVTIRELLETNRFGEHEWSPQALRLTMLKTHYRQPIDWTVRALKESEETLQSMYYAVGGISPGEHSPAIEAALCDDLNTPFATTELLRLWKSKSDPEVLAGSLKFLGIDLSAGSSYVSPVRRAIEQAKAKVEDLEEKVKRSIADRTSARARKDFKESDRIRDELAAMGVVLKDGKDADGKPVTTWEIAR